MNELAQRPADLTSLVAQQQDEREALLVADDKIEAPGFADLLQGIEELLPDWFEVVQEDPINTAQHQAVVTAYEERIAKLEQANRPRGPILATITRWARDEVPLGRRRLEHAEVYVARTAALDPLVNSAIRTAEDYPGLAPALENLRDQVAEAIEVIEESNERFRRGAIAFGEFAREREHTSRAWREVAQLYSRGDRMVDEGNALVEAWWERLQALFAASEDEATGIE